MRSGYNTLMRAELLTVGSELISGATVNTNAAYLARRLAELGIACARQVTVDDDPARLRQALREGLRGGEVLITTGGLGPTFDDITMASIAEVTGRPLVYAARAGTSIRRFYARRHRALQRAALRQAYLPAGGIPLRNPLGTAPGLWLALPGHLLIALPGVPREMRAIFDREALPRLRGRAGGPVVSRTLRTIGLVELSIEALLKRLRLPSDIQVGLYPHLRMVDVRLTARAASARAAANRLRGAEARLRRALGQAVYGSDEETLEAVVGALLVRRRKTLALAESCSGGALAHRITNVPGSSRYLRGAVVAYHNDVKRTLLGVPAALLERHGAVSGPVARAMAEGARRIAGADLGVGITGIAGPGGATRGKPVGLVYLAMTDGRRARVHRHCFVGDRAAIKAQAVQAALDELRRLLSSSRHA